MGIQYDAVAAKLLYITGGYSVPLLKNFCGVSYALPDKLPHHKRDPTRPSSLH